MAASIINRLNNAVNGFERLIHFILSNRFPPGSIGVLDFDTSTSLPNQINKSSTPFSLENLVGNGFLWGVPKTRRPIEKRLCRRYGDPERIWKMITRKTNLIMCPNCGHDYEGTKICGHCWKRVKAETTEMQEAIKSDLKLDPVEKEVVVIYENEKENINKEFWKSQRIVEISKKRPAWFHSNLMQSTTQQPSEGKEVKPTELA